MNIMRITDEAGWVSCKAPRLMLRSLKDAGKQGLISRELRLFACGCVRHIGELLAFEQSWQAVDVAERYADGDASQYELKAAYDAAQLAEHSIRQRIKKINSETQASGGSEVIEAWRLFQIDDCHPEGRRKNAAHAASLCAHNLVITSNIDQNVQYCGDWNLAVAASTSAYLASASRDSLDALEVMFLAHNGEYPLYEDGWQADLVRCIFRNAFRQAAAHKLEMEPYIRDMAESIYCLRAFDRTSVLGKELEARRCVDTDLVAHCISDRVHARGCWALDMARGLKRDY
jgi:hypothetical protein